MNFISEQSQEALKKRHGAGVAAYRILGYLLFAGVFTVFSVGFSAPQQGFSADSITIVLKLSRTYGSTLTIPNNNAKNKSHSHSSPDQKNHITPKYPKDGIEVGVLSQKPSTWFESRRNGMDQENQTQRCQRYGFSYNNSANINRRIFYGGIMADEPWELFEVVSAESRGLFHAIVFVESNLTQSLFPRRFQRLHHATTIQNLFAPISGKVIVKAFTNSDQRLKHLNREAALRQEVVKGWAELGMQHDDVGLLADLDEMFSRDFLQAIRTCDSIKALDYKQHYCRHNLVKINNVGLDFEMSPECIAQDFVISKPNLMLGHCIEGIGDTFKHPLAPRRGKRKYFRADGFGGKHCGDWAGEDKIHDNRYPLWNSADIRGCGGQSIFVNTSKYPEYSPYTGFHFHNFFANLRTMRHKYLTYGHPIENALSVPLDQILERDLRMAYRCLKDMPNDKHGNPHIRKRIMGGFAKLKRPLPIYFQDDEYRARRHKRAVQMLQNDEKMLRHK